MKVYVNVVDIRTGIYQSGMINEQIQKGFEIDNALMHFGVNGNSVDWKYSTDVHKFGEVKGTTKVVSITCVG